MNQEQVKIFNKAITQLSKYDRKTAKVLLEQMIQATENISVTK